MTSDTTQFLQNESFAAPPEISAETFLQRAEAARLKSECFLGLDMRKLVRTPCKRYVYLGRTLWLDNVSHALFVEGFKKNGGVFTVATYEAIVRQAGGRGWTEGNDVAAAELVAPGNGAAAQTMPRMSLQNRELVPFHETDVLELGYFEQREDVRVRQALPALVTTGSGVFEGRTRDISQKGLQIRARRRMELKEGEVVRVRIPELEGAGGAERFSARYRVVRVSRLLQETRLSLLCEEHDLHPLTEKIGELVSEQARGEDLLSRLDAEDAALTAMALLAERHYARSTPLIPFFVLRNEDKTLQLHALCTNENNAHFLRVFELGSERYDFSGLTDPARLKTLSRMSRVDGRANPLFSVYRVAAEDRVELIANFDCRHEMDWYRHLARHRYSEDFRVFKPMIRRISRPSTKRISRELEKLSSKSSEEARQIRRDTRRLVAAGALVDVTPQVRKWELTPYEAMAETVTSTSPVSRNDRSLVGTRTLNLGFEERKREQERFLCRLNVTLSHEGRKLTGETRDVSPNGLSLILEAEEPSVDIGTRLLITFPEDFRQHAGVLERLRKRFQDVAFQVVAVDRGDRRLLRLQLASGVQSDGFKRAMADFLETRRTRLRLELSNSVHAAAARVYSSLFVESSASLPLFLFAESDGGKVFARVAMAGNPCPLAYFFEVADGEFDFSILTAQPVLQRLQTQLQANNTAEVVVYMYKQRLEGVPRFVIHGKPEFEFSDAAKRHAFVKMALGHHFCAVKLFAAGVRAPAGQEITHILNPLESCSPHKAEAIRTDFAALRAIADVVDISGQVDETQAFARDG